MIYIIHCVNEPHISQGFVCVCVCARMLGIEPKASYMHAFYYWAISLAQGLILNIITKVS
jgi:membrane-associated PAP2 superfamily phosphatase